MKSNEPREIDLTNYESIEHVTVVRGKIEEDNRDHAPHYFEREDYNSTEEADTIEYGGYDTVYIWTEDTVRKISGERYEGGSFPRNPDDLDLS